MAPIRLAVFRFVIRRLGALRRFPFLVHTFDLFLRGLTAVTAPAVLHEIHALTGELAGWPGVTLSRHRLGGREFDYQHTELGHVHSNGVVDVRLTRPEHDDVLARGLATLHHVAPASSWVTFVIERAGDARAAAALLAIPFQRLEHGGAPEEPTEENG